MRHGSALPAHRFPLVDVVRGVAALAIAFFHTYSYGEPASTRVGLLVERFASNLGIGVAIFFVISGFVLYRPWLLARETGRPQPQVLSYLWRRFLRIVPAFWVAMIVTVVVYDMGGTLFGWTGVSSFLFVQIYAGDHTGILGPAWSLDTELAWYILLPVLAAAAGGWATRSRNGEWTPVLALLGLGLVLLLTYHLVLSVPDWWAYLLPFWFTHFALGMTLAVASVRDWAPARRVARHGVWCVLVAIAAYGVMASSDYLVIYDVPVPDWLLPLIDALLGMVVALGLLLPAIWDDGRRTGLRGIAGSRPAVYLGVISYGIFLYHGTAFKIASDLGVPVYGFQLGALVGFAVTIAMASLSWHLIERPALSLKRLVGRRTEPTAPAAAGTDHPAIVEMARGRGV
jgi:peptidoglycan/LPS O-acetylase OafA/YrhL